MIEPWDPWCLKPTTGAICLGKDGIRLVQPMANQEASVSLEEHLETNESSGIPVGLETPLPSLCKLVSTEPSSLLTVHLVDIVHSYCFTLRVYNGD